MEVLQLSSNVGFLLAVLGIGYLAGRILTEIIR